MLSLSTSSPASRGRGLGEGAGSRGTSVQGRRSGEITGIEEEDEDDIEEVEEFSPVIGGPAECVEVVEETTAGAEGKEKATREEKPLVPEKESPPPPAPLEKEMKN